MTLNPPAGSILLRTLAASEATGLAATNSADFPLRIDTATHPFAAQLLDYAERSFIKKVFAVSCPLAFIGAAACPVFVDWLEALLQAPDNKSQSCDCASLRSRE